jgi:CTP:molybdopterin cytidylyltransferase MocA
LPWPPRADNARPLVAVAFDAIARVCDAMVVVVDHEAEAVLAALGDRMFYREVVGKSSQPMFASIQIGLQMAKRIDADADAVLQPADHPQVRLDTLQSLISEGAEQSDRAIMPLYRGRGGHPALIPPNVARLIRNYDGHGGLRQFWIDRPHLCHRLPVDDPGVVFDVDTPSDYDFYVQ